MSNKQIKDESPIIYIKLTKQEQSGVITTVWVDINDIKNISLDPRFINNRISGLRLYSVIFTDDIEWITPISEEDIKIFNKKQKKY